MRRTQVGYRGRIGRTQHGLSREGPLLGGIPQRLGSDTISPSPHLPFEYVHSSSHIPGLWQAKPVREGITAPWVLILPLKNAKVGLVVVFAHQIGVRRPH